MCFRATRGSAASRARLSPTTGGLGPRSSRPRWISTATPWRGSPRACGPFGPRASSEFQVSTLDRYILRLTLAPLAGALGVTLVALLLERVLRLLDLLSESSGR